MLASRVPPKRTTVRATADRKIIRLRLSLLVCDRRLVLCGLEEGRAAAAPACGRRRETNVFGGESSRGRACVLVRCSVYPWASGSACRVDIEGGAVLLQLVLLTYRGVTRKATVGSRVA